LLGLYDEAVHFFPVGLEVFYELLPQASTELHSMMQNSHFHHTYENGKIVLPAYSKTW
jgi:hypothetical protein